MLPASAFPRSAVEDTIEKTKAEIADPELRWMFENCYPNTLDTTVEMAVVDGRPDTFIITWFPRYIGATCFTNAHQ